MKNRDIYKSLTICVVSHNLFSHFLWGRLKWPFLRRKKIPETSIPGTRKFCRSKFSAPPFLRFPENTCANLGKGQNSDKQNSDKQNSENGWQSVHHFVKSWIEFWRSEITYVIRFDHFVESQFLVRLGC